MDDAPQGTSSPADQWHSQAQAHLPDFGRTGEGETDVADLPVW